MHELRIRAECNLPLGGELDQPKKGFQVALFCSWRNRGGKSRSLGSKFKPRQETLLWSFVSGMRQQRAIHDPRASIFRNPKPGDAALSVSGADVLSCWWGLLGECKFLVLPQWQCVNASTDKWSVASIRKLWILCTPFPCSF